MEAAGGCLQPFRSAARVSVDRETIRVGPSPRDRLREIRQEGNSEHDREFATPSVSPSSFSLFDAFYSLIFQPSAIIPSPSSSATVRSSCWSQVVIPNMVVCSRGSHANSSFCVTSARVGTSMSNRLGKIMSQVGHKGAWCCVENVAWGR